MPEIRESVKSKCVTDFKDYEVRTYYTRFFFPCSCISGHMYVWVGSMWLAWIRDATPAWLTNHLRWVGHEPGRGSHWPLGRSHTVTQIPLDIHD